jgi:hypothetical protein
MSNNKSRTLARQSGGHSIYFPRSGQSDTYEEIQDRIKFIRTVTGRNSREDTLVLFKSISDRFSSQPEILDGISRRAGMPKEEVVEKLLFLRSKYQSLFALQQLFSYERW